MTCEGTIIGHYKLTRILGKGGMGEVYLAQDTRIDRNVAIKIVRDEVSPYPHSNALNDSVRLFEREMKAITALDHPNILPLYEFGEERIEMAPEQWNGTSVPATDQYALAVMTYQLLTGTSPFEGNMQQLMYKHLFVSPMPPSAVNASIPRAADTVLLQALAKKTEDRFTSILDYADAFVRAWQSQDNSLASTFLPASETLLPTVIVASRSTAPKPVPLTTEEPVKSKVRSRKDSKSWSLPAIIAVSFVIGIGILVFLFSHSFSFLTAASTQGTPSPRNTATVIVSPPSTLPVTTTFAAYPQLKSFYNGTAWGYLNAYVTFTLTKEDAQGGVAMTTTFQQADNPQKIARYSCLGSVTHANHLHLDCKSTADARYLLTIDAVVYSDGHMEGTEIATITDNSSYYHFYNWTAS